ncbi:ANTAR domain-containing protein [Modestobacter sp. VKM Ac-2986]|uniref:ANTAR domain-containing protein n=1 Tax=Modestobacter sp. VKM Ac-2986 TaxID=3004140 RepID=UPI0022AB5770|nr:ANTAR domain-containing protein [Modestobacter sp. VKM Ac-2986]MCZ2829656.1 ANTAR domain-containing protein [Modestobacter sp. VKM Ac-2986]
MRRPIPVAFPPGVLHGPSGGPAAVVVRTTRGWAVLSGDRHATPEPEPADVVRDGLTLVEAMTLADLLTSELGAGPEPDRASRRAARATAGGAGLDPADAPDPRDAELAALRRTVGQLEHALAARVSIERAIGVLAERHGTTPRAAFEDLRGRARSQGRPATDLAAEVLDGLPLRPASPRPGDPDPTAPERSAEPGTMS